MLKSNSRFLQNFAEFHISQNLSEEVEFRSKDKSPSIILKIFIFDLKNPTSTKKFQAIEVESRAQNKMA